MTELFSACAGGKVELPKDKRIINNYWENRI